MMTDDQAEIAHDKYMDIAQAITELVNRMTNGLTLEQDTYVRNQLNDTQRYWREGV
jgi:hypothetical protein